MVDATGCAIVTSKFSVDVTSASSINFVVNVSGWADVHYILNGAGQQNFRMTNTGSSNVKALSGLTNGDSIDYSFTYLDDDSSVKTSAWITYTFAGVVAADSDNDGVDDAIDQCSGTPANTVVDAVGCAVVIDADNDGVDDAIDQCLGTPANTVVDSVGCAVIIDADNDGVDDAIDQCLGTPANTAVDAVGCAVVAEKFGITATSADSIDFFVNVNGWADVHYTLNGAGQQNFRMTHNANGNIKTLSGLNQGDYIEYNFTYLDDDGSVKDSVWASYTFAEVVVGDADNDGVNDNIDQCSDTANGVEVDDVGCPVDTTDTDSDGVPDVQDQCPNTTSGATVDSVGCEVIADTIEVASANEILVGGADSSNPGHSLYVFDNDSGGGSNCNDGCAVSWPPVLVTDGFATGVGSLGTITRNDGALQATYNGRPLYFYANDTTAGQTNGQGAGGVWWTVEYGTGSIVPLFSSSTTLEQAILFDRGDALVTRFADRGRDRHAKEDHFQVYDHYLSHYWTHRTAQFEFVDYVAKGGSTIEITFITEWKLGAREFRAWYRGLGTVAEYHGNYFGGGAVVELDNGSYDHNFNKISEFGDQYRYQLIISDYRPLNWSASDGLLPLAVGQRMELEVSQFLDAVPEGRNNYYGTTYLYIVGQGLVPWKTVGDFADSSSEREDSYPIAESGWLGGKTTLPYNYTAEPDNHFMQMSTNLSNVNGQSFVLGRRVHHTDFETGQHDESSANGVFNELAAKAGTHYVNTSCSSCHERNGRASVADIGLPLDKWVFKVAGADGQADAQIGSILQPNNIGIDPALGEGTVSIASWTENNGLRSPNYAFSNGAPALFSARLAPQLVGLGLLEALSEMTILAREDVNDANGDGISGKAQLSTDPVTGQTRLGRFGYKAGTSSIKHQVAAALNTDIGVMTSVLPNPDCGSAQTTCGNTAGSEISDENLNNLVKYIALLGVRPQRDLDNADVILGEAKFNEIGCESCHRDNMQTSEFAQFAELRNQTIHPFTDLLLHDMGAGLADNLGEGEATGAEWRTTPLWGLGLSACVTGGLTNPTGQQGGEICTPDASYLHDGRARTIEEAVLWHGGEGEASKVAYQSLNAADKAALLAFLGSL
ncbi:MAG: thiol oxidoreductase [Alteromonadaceae bacterium]|nr:thiol oxidoreductase [Alteromonadaceae bacterium]